jgi:glutamine synthetase
MELPLVEESLDFEAPAYVRFEIVDFNGKALSKTVPWRHRNESTYMYSGAIALGASARVMTFPDEVIEKKMGNICLVPIWSTRRVLPWAQTEAGSVERVYCHYAQREIPLPRIVCLRMLEKLKKFDGGRGIEMLSASELEFTVHRRRAETQEWAPIFEGVDIFSTLQTAKAMAFCSKVETQMFKAGVDVVTINAEYGAGQIEMPLAPAFGIDAADQVRIQQA